MLSRVSAFEGQAKFAMLAVVKEHLYRQSGKSDKMGGPERKEKPVTAIPGLAAMII